ncbi:MAG: hypothetical protein WA777_09650 [Rhodanobacter sp.]
MDAHVLQRTGVVRLRLHSFERRWPGGLLAVVWTLLLALLPWWLDLPLLLTLSVALLVWTHWLGEHAQTMRRALRWGLPGLLVAVFRALAGNPLAWLLVLLVALAGFSLLMLLESWLDRGKHAMPSSLLPMEWSELALAPIGPTAAIIELQPPAWLAVDQEVTDPRGDEVHYANHTFRLGVGRQIEGVDPRYCFSPDGCWFAAVLTAGRGLALQDCQRDRLYRLRGWQLIGWYAGQPWLSRGENHAPIALSHVLGRDED